MKVGRLPPRSRSGCWTCRARKVKCDEDRPRCKQCVRLSHDCDYSPRLAFRDETPKVVDKYIEVGATATDESPTVSTSTNSFINVQDDLPPFTYLTNDEDWQKKALYRPPGTYYIVTNTKTFSDAIEHTKNITPRGTCGAMEHSPQISGANVFIDQATVILGKFDPGSKTPIPNANLMGTFDRVSSDSDGSSSLATTVSADSAQCLENELLCHWLGVVRSRIVEGYHHGPIAIDVGDIIETAARSYPPLYCAIFAVSSLSLATRQRLQIVQSVQYYTRALIALREFPGQILSSNESFLTYYLLLIYQIAAADRFWYHHMETLKHIIAIRKQTLSRDPFAHIVLDICNIDAAALMSCSGDGSLVYNQLNMATIPPTRDSFGTLSNLAAQPDTKGFSGPWPPVFDMLQDLLHFQAKLGQLSWTFRQEIQDRENLAGETQSDSNLVVGAVEITEWNEQVLQARAALRHYWNQLLAQHSASGGDVKEIHQQATLVYQSIMIYSYTSMWSTQLGKVQFLQHDLLDLQHAITSTLDIARDLVAHKSQQQRFVSFALLLAGVATRVVDEQVAAVELLKVFERSALGYNVRATRILLESVLQRKAEKKSLGMDEHVDWMLMAQELGWQYLMHFSI